MTTSAVPCSPATRKGEPSRLGQIETVVKPPGLSSPCTMQCGEGLLTAFGVGFTPHVQRQARTDLLVRPHPVDLLLHLAIAPVAPLHRIRGGGQQLVIEKREGFVQRGGKELLQGLPQLGEPLEPTPQTHDGFEWLYVLNGRLRLVVGERDLTLPPGEAAEFDTSLPHWLGSADGGTVELLILFGLQGLRSHVHADPR